MVKLHLVEFAEVLKKVINRTLGQGKSIGTFSNECISEAKIWGARYDTGTLAAKNNSGLSHEHPHKGMESSTALLPPETRQPLMTKNTEVPVTINPKTLQLYDEFLAMDKAKAAQDRTKKDWEDMDKKAIELLDSLK